MTELQSNLEAILEEKTTKIIPENIKDGVEILGVEGNLKAGSTITIKRWGDE